MHRENRLAALRVEHPLVASGVWQVENVLRDSFIEVFATRDDARNVVANFAVIASQGFPINRCAIRKGRARHSSNNRRLAFELLARRLEDAARWIDDSH